jgi:hypothetical protein
MMPTVVGKAILTLKRHSPSQERTADWIIIQQNDRRAYIGEMT